ncbi:MAG: PKD domain-containing protein, partial [Acidobacteriota bacterium]
SFGDGATSTSQNPSHTFTTVASYTVSLTVTNASSSASTSRTVDVLPSTTLSASFTYNPSAPTAAQSVQFTDTTTGTPTSWSWSFGDGATSASQNPSHTYTAAGSYTVNLTATNASGSDAASASITVASASAIIINHSTISLADIPSEWISAAKQSLHIAYGHTSHGSQLTTGMTGLVTWKGTLYSWNSGGTDGALDLRDYYGNFGGVGIANDLGADINGSLDRSAWEEATRAYLNTNPGVNVIIWAWCWQVGGSVSDIQLYLDLMSQLEEDYPNIKFVYMTGHLDGCALTGNSWEIATALRNQQIRDYCVANNKILYDFADIESYDPDGMYFGDKLANDNCDYDSDGNGTRDKNWAIDWENAHPGEWYTCSAAHTQPLNANMKAYAAWWLWARLAGWGGT